MSQKATKEQMPAMIAELVNRENNVKTLVLVKQFLEMVAIRGEQAKDLSRCLHWIEGVIQGETTRISDLKEKLPDQDTEIKLGPEEPAEPDQAPSGVSVGGVELQKGEPVLGAV